ncbi:MAG: glycosyltransferase family 2 protein [Flavobacteriaceae bacterium]
MDVSIIIVNYNTKDLILNCLQSIFDFTLGINFEVIVVDNASQDGSCNSIQDKFPQVNLISSKENLGFGRANNLGAKEASGTFLFLLNSDTLLFENSIKILKDFLENSNEQNIGIVGCKLVDSNKNPDISYGNFPTIYQEIFEYGLSKIFKKYFKNKLSPAVIDGGSLIKKVDYVMGADMFMKKEVFEAVGGFDEDFFLYYEETEICFRLNSLGYKIIWNPNTSIIHYIGASGKKQDGINYWILEQLQKSKILYYKKCHGNAAASIAKYITFPKALIKYRKFDIRKIFRIFF